MARGNVNKLARLKKLNLKELKDDIETNPRTAVVVAFKAGVITHWIDDGNFYSLGLSDGKLKQLRKHQVCEFLIDKILSMEDPLDKTAKEPVKKTTRKSTKPKEEPEEEK